MDEEKENEEESRRRRMEKVAEILQVSKVHGRICKCIIMRKNVRYEMGASFKVGTLELRALNNSYYKRVNNANAWI